MDKLAIEGKHQLNGCIDIAGAKNAALPIICAALLTEDEVILHNVPDLKDIHTLKNILMSIGVKAEYDHHAHTLSIQAKHIDSTLIAYDMVKTMRASILLLGPLLTRFGEAKVSLPGGCAIGARPVDQHIKGLQKMQADIVIDHGYIQAKASKLQGARIVTDMITVTGTANLMMAACLAEGKTIIENAAREPEVVDLAHFLCAMGAKIEGMGSDCITIYGIERLHGAHYTVMADRIEAGTFLCAVGATQGDITLQNIDANILDAVLQKLRESGLELEVHTSQKTIRARMHRRAKAVGFRSTEYPGFPTDMQAQYMALNTIAQGSAQITETIFENRFMHVQELLRLGADIQVNGRVAVVQGVESLSGTHVMATDLRASAGLIIAGLVADGVTTIERIYHLDRGYEKIEQKLCQLGARVQRLKASS